MSFSPLKIVSGNEYYITDPLPFSNSFPLDQYVIETFSFAWEMTFGKAGQHRPIRSGGVVNRKNGEIFINAFQGKLAEFGFYDFMIRSGFFVEKPDVNAWGRGKWDEWDFVVNNKKIAIKSAAYFSNLLLLETKDWDLNGNYLHSESSAKAKYDFFVLCRINPDAKSIMKTHRIMYSDDLDLKKLSDIIKSALWFCDIAGYITIEEFKEIIKLKHVIPQGAFLNRKTKMDADNFYVQAKDLRNINTLTHLLK